jgi:hypothetical protein
MALSLIFTWNWYFYWLLHEIGTFIDFYMKLVLLLTFTWNWYFYWLLHEIGTFIDFYMKLVLLSVFKGNNSCKTYNFRIRVGNVQMVYEELDLAINLI